MTIPELETHLAELEAEAIALKAAIPNLEAQLKEAQSRLDELTGRRFGFRGAGYIESARAELHRAKAKEADDKLRRVRTRSIDSGRPHDNAMIVRKVTEKLIYLSVPGCERAERYDKETGKQAIARPYIEIHPDDLKWILA
jgi:hypothetical protein